MQDRQRNWKQFFLLWDLQRKMADKAIEPGKKSTERYLPEAAWKAMSKAERKKTDDKKKRESRKGKQFVENTEKAKRARRMASKKAKRSMKND